MSLWDQFHFLFNGPWIENTFSFLYLIFNMLTLAIHSCVVFFFRFKCVLTALKSAKPQREVW